MSVYLEAKKGEFLKTISFFKSDISSLRTGRINPGLLDGVQAESYGVKTPLNGLANISVVDGKSLTIAPWDKNVLKDIERSIAEANLGFNSVNEGNKLRLTMPPMTEESRKEMVKKLNDKMETARVAIRQLRDEVKSSIEQAEENKELSEDDKFRFIKELDEEVRKKNDELKEIRDKKEKEIMTI